MIVEQKPEYHARIRWSQRSNQWIDYDKGYKCDGEESIVSRDRLTSEVLEIPCGLLALKSDVLNERGEEFVFDGLSLRVVDYCFEKDTVLALESYQLSDEDFPETRLFIWRLSKAFENYALFIVEAHSREEAEEIARQSHVDISDAIIQTPTKPEISLRAGKNLMQTIRIKK
jgi:hypothetical protein